MMANSMTCTVAFRLQGKRKPSRGRLPQIMDQRVDDERRQETLPGRPARPTAAERQQEPSFIEGLRARRTLVLAIAAIAIAVAVGGIVWWINSSHYLSTDDAFIDARTVTISAQINAHFLRPSPNPCRLRRIGERCIHVRPSARAPDTRH